MKILKYKKISGVKYKIFLDDNREFSLYEDVILKFELLLKKDIDENTVNEMCKLNLLYDVYYVALNNIKARMKSTNELRDVLLKKEYPEDLVDEAIDMLTKQGYLNDRLFAKSYISNQINSTSNGPHRIENDLYSKKVDSDIINDEISVYDDSIQIEKINKLVNHKLRSNNSRGGMVLRKKIFTDLIQLGFDDYNINQILNNVSFGNNNELAKKEYEKAMRKYSKKYSGAQLELKVREYLYQKGLKYDEE